MAAKREERKKLVMIGNLPDNFLRIVPKEQALPVHQLEASSISFAPPNVAGTLSVTIVEAELTKNYGFTKMDPYVRVRIGHDLYETPTDLRGSKRPVWNKTFQSYLPQGIRTILFDVYDERALVPDERIAWGNLTLPEDLFLGEYVNVWVTLSGKQGEDKEGKLHVICNFAPSAAHPPFASAPMMILPAPLYGGMPPYYYGNAMQYPPAVPHRYPASSVNQRVPQPPPQPLSESDLQQLQEMFPSFDKEAISSVVESSGQNKDKAINTLLQMSAE